MYAVVRLHVFLHDQYYFPIITFNFINVTWVFFRAKEWDDALKVLKGMIGMDGVMLPEKYAEKFSFLHDLGFQFGSVLGDINGKAQTIAYIVLAFIIVLKFNNSSQLAANFKSTKLSLLFTLALLLTAISMMSRVSEFLYFNF